MAASQSCATGARTAKPRCAIQNNTANSYSLMYLHNFPTPTRPGCRIPIWLDLFVAREITTCDDRGFARRLTQCETSSIRRDPRRTIATVAAWPYELEFLPGL